MKYLLIGGLGFIGQNFANYLLEHDHEVLIVDALSPQVHKWGDTQYCGTRIKVCDFAEVEHYRDFLKECHYLVHLAAETGTGQSMYQMERYVVQNVQKLAKLLETLAASDLENLKGIALSSSRSVYGEGTYRCAEHGLVYSPKRKLPDLRSKHYEPKCAVCGSAMVAVATSEAAALNPVSVYASTKLAQELLFQNFSEMYDIPASIFRFQNVYGEGQSLNNPYTGILAIFSNLARSSSDISVFEDGLETRDFVHVYDVCKAMYAIIGAHSGAEIFNIGTGNSHTVLTVAQEINSYFGARSRIIISHGFRKGDIRHNFADISKIESFVDVNDFIKFGEGLKRFLDWATLHPLGDVDLFSKSIGELTDKGLLVSNG